MKTKPHYPFLRVENGQRDKFISNGNQSIYIFPNPDNAGELQAYWISTYDYQTNSVVDQRVVSKPTLEALITTTFYN